MSDKDLRKKAMESFQEGIKNMNPEDWGAFLDGLKRAEREFPGGGITSMTEEEYQQMLREKKKAK